MTVSPDAPVQDSWIFSGGMAGNLADSPGQRASGMPSRSFVKASSGMVRRTSMSRPASPPASFSAWASVASSGVSIASFLGILF